MKRILVIEDEHILRGDIAEILQFEGFEVLQAENGVLGVRLARQHQPDLIICDIMMPELDGYGVLMELQSFAPTSQIPFIFLTAKTGRSDMRRGMELGADDYLTKPFTQQELIASVKTRISKHIQVQKDYEERLEKLRARVIRALPQELRNPLTGIIGYARMLMEDSHIDPVQIEQMASGIDKSAQRLHRLIENYLLYAQIELLQSDSQRIQEIQKQNTPDALLIIQDTAMYKASEYKRANDLDCRCLGEYDVQISIENLEKIATELIDNAFKFSPPQTPVHIHLEAQDQYLKWEIQNQGQGIGPDQVEAVGAYAQFERQVYEHNGLGLVISKRLIELHQGRLEIKNLENQITSITVYLPFHTKTQ